MDKPIGPKGEAQEGHKERSAIPTGNAMDKQRRTIGSAVVDVDAAAVVVVVG